MYFSNSVKCISHILLSVFFKFCQVYFSYSVKCISQQWRGVKIPTHNALSVGSVAHYPPFFHIYLILPTLYPCDSHFFISLGNVTSEHFPWLKVVGCLRKKYNWPEQVSACNCSVQLGAVQCLQVAMERIHTETI